MDSTKERHRYFKQSELEILDQAVTVAEDLVNNHYKLSASQMLQLNYDIKTARYLLDTERSDKHFAQIVCYTVRKNGELFKADSDDFYKICIQDHVILSVLKTTPDLRLLPFLTYIICHELIHVVRFRRFLQHFNVSPAERLAEETRVHKKTNELLSNLRIKGISQVLAFFDAWRHAGFGKRQI